MLTPGFLLPEAFLALEGDASFLSDGFTLLRGVFLPSILARGTLPDFGFRFSAKVSLAPRGDGLSPSCDIPDDRWRAERGFAWTLMSCALNRPGSGAGTSPSLEGRLNFERAPSGFAIGASDVLRGDLAPPLMLPRCVFFPSVAFPKRRFIPNTTRPFHAPKKKWAAARQHTSVTGHKSTKYCKLLRGPNCRLRRKLEGCSVRIAACGGCPTGWGPGLVTWRR